MDGGLAF
jgi:hypothetical protein